MDIASSKLKTPRGYWISDMKFLRHLLVVSGTVVLCKECYLSPSSLLEDHILVCFTSWQRFVSEFFMVKRVSEVTVVKSCRLT